MERYKGIKRHEVPPHVFAITDTAYRSMLQGELMTSYTFTPDLWEYRFVEMNRLKNMRWPFRDLVVWFCGILSISDNRKGLTNCANFHRKILHIVIEELVSKSKTFVASINQIFAGGFSDLSFGVMFSCLGHYCYSIWKKRNRRELKPKQIYFRRKLCFQLCRRP